MKICNRLLSLVLAVLMLVPLSIFPAVAAEDDEEFVDTNFSFEIESVTYTEADNPAAGDTISLEVRVQNLTDEDDLGSIELRLNYDDTKLEFVAAREKTGTGKNAVTHMAGYFGLFQSAAPATNPAKNYIVNVDFENQCWDSEWDINNDIFMMVDFKVLGDWGGSTEIQLDGQAQRRADALFYRGENNTRDITWGKGTVTRPGAAAEPELESIAVTTLPTKTEYLESAPGEFDPAGGKLTLTYDDESTKEIDLSEAVVTGFDDTQVGKQTLTVSYEGKTCTLEVTILPASITGISVDALPSKLTYIEGEELDLTGGMIEVAYNNGTYTYQRMLDATVTGYDKNTVGPQTVTVTYEGLTCTFEVTVTAKEVVDIVSFIAPNKLVYLEGEDELDLSGGTFRVLYNNNTTEDLPLSAATVTGFDNTIPGTCDLVATYEGFTMNFSVEIVAKSITSIMTLTPPTKALYLEGKDALDLAGGTFRVFYNNNTSDDLPMTEADVTGFDNTTPGDCVVTVTYQGFTTQFSVYIVEKTVDHIVVLTGPTKTTYFVGEELDLTGGELTVYYNNDTSDVIALSDVTVTGFDSETAGVKVLTAEYQQHTAGFEVTVVEKEVASIEVTTLPTKLVYKENKAGERELDPAGGIITVTYEDSSTSTVALSEATLSGFDTFTVGQQEITVSYAGKTCTYTVTVEAKVITRIEIADAHNIQTEYLEGKGELCISGPVSQASLYVFYDNDTYDGAPLELNMITGFDNTVVGKQTLTVTYEGLTTTFEVEIIAKSVSSIELVSPITKTEYLEGKDALDVTGGKIKVNYNNDTDEVIDLTASMVTGFDKNAVGPQTLTVTYEGKSATLSVTVIAKTAESISLTKNPDKMQYLLGSTEPFDPTGGEITVYYNNDTQEVVSLADAEVVGFATLLEGPVLLDVRYASCTLQFSVDIVLKAPLVITEQPEELVVKAYKDTATVTVAATGEGKLTYAWYYKDKGMAAFKLTTSFTGNTYSVAMTGARSGRQIYCKITDEFGDEITTDVCTLAMEARIAKQPASVTVAYGKTATVTVKAEGEGLTYKWYYKNKGATKFVRTTTFSGDTYTVEMNASRSGRQIYVIVEDQFGNRVASKIVTISMEARIATQPKSVTVASGKLAKATVKAQGEGLKYTWYYKDKGASKFVKTSSFTGSSYYVYMNGARDGRQIYCKITDKFGNTVTTNTVTLKMK